MTQPRVSIVVPAHNEAGNIPLLLEKFDAMFKESSLQGEVIAVNDGSTDGTLAELEKGRAKYSFLKVVSHRRKEGITAALDSGFRQAIGEILTFYPADLELLPEDLPPLIRKMDEGYDLVAAWRQGKRGGKQFVTVVYNLLCRLLFKVTVHDLNCAKAFKREILERFALQEDWHRYMIVLATDAGYRIGEVKIPLYPRKHGKSKFGIERILRGFWDLVVVLFVVKFSRKPMRLFGNLGLLSAVVGTLLAAYLSWMHFLGQRIGDRPMLLLSMLLIITGIQFFGLGLLGELINRKSERRYRHDG